MHRECERSAGKSQILGGRHDEAEVAIVSTAACRGDGACICVNLFGEEFDSGVSGGANDGGEA